MAGSVATLAILWVSLQTLGFLGHSHSIGTYKVPESLQNYLAAGKYLLQSDLIKNLTPRNMKGRESNFMILAPANISINILVEISVGITVV